MKNWIVVSLLVITLGSCSIKPLAFEGIEKPNVETLKLDGSDIGFNIRIKNPNTMGFKIVKSNLVVTVNNIEAGKVYVSKKTKVKANNSTAIPLSLKLDNSKLIGLGAMALFGDPEVQIKGMIKGRKFIFSKKYAVDFKDHISISDFIGQ